MYTPVRPHPVALMVSALVSAVLAACSLQTYDLEACSGNDECVVSFGAGSTCRSGYCSRPSSCSRDRDCLELAAGATCGPEDRCTPPLACTSDEECETSFGLGATCGPGYCVGNTPCASTPDCTRTFGWTSTCDDGICRELPANLECALTWPRDLLSSDEYNDYRVVGQLFNRSEHTIEGRAAEAVIRVLNDRGGISGQRLGLVQCNQGSTREATARATRYLVQLGASVVVGAMNSDATEAAFDVAAAARIPMITPAAGSPSLTDRRVGDQRARPSGNQPGFLFRTIQDDEAQVEVIAQRFRDEGYGSVGIIFRQGAYGNDIQTLLVRALNEAPRIETQSRGFGTNVANLDEELGEAINVMASRNPDIVVFASPDTFDYVTFLDFISDDNADAFWRNRPLWFTDVAYNRQLANQMDERVYAFFDSITGSRPAPRTDTALYSDFITQYDTIHGNPNDPRITAYSATTFDATWLAVLGIARLIATTESSSESDGLRAARGIRLALSGEGTPISLQPGNLSALLSRISDGQPFQVEGASGDLLIDRETNQLLRDSARVELWRLIEPEEPGCEDSARPCFQRVD